MKVSYTAHYSYKPVYQLVGISLNPLQQSDRTWRLATLKREDEVLTFTCLGVISGWTFLAGMWIPA